MNQTVPVLITCDIDPTPEVTPEDKREALRQTLGIFDDYRVKATFFFVAGVAKQYGENLNTLIEAGHEVGCHGLTHDESEEYGRMPETEQRRMLEQATSILSRITGRQIRSFRGPRVKTSHITQRILEELGYFADSSVCSQRLDFISSNLINMNWVFAPRNVYHPRTNNAFRRGDEKITVVPVSAIGLPFISSTLYVLGLNPMKRFFDLLYRESLRTGKPIVYLMHPSELATRHREVHYQTTLKDIKSRGFYFRRHLKLGRPAEERAQLNRALLDYMGRRPNARFMCVDQFVSSKNL